MWTHSMLAVALLLAPGTRAAPVPAQPFGGPVAGMPESAALAPAAEARDLAGAGRPGGARAGGPGVRWGPPLRPPLLISRFDPPAQPWLPGHRGIDLRAAPGAPVHAAGSGRVTFARALAGRGVVVVDHGELRTTYEPVDPSVAVGTRVRVGEPIGRVTTGSGHCGDGRCLHLGLRRGATYLDPTLLVRRAHPVLRPW